MVTRERNESVSLRCRQCSSALRSLKRAMSSLSCFSAESFSASSCRCSACTSSSSFSICASSFSGSDRLARAFSRSDSAESRRVSSDMPAAAWSETHIREVRTACIHSCISFSLSAASTTLSPPACDNTNVNGRAVFSSRSRTFASSRSTTPLGLSRKPRKSRGAWKYMSTLSRNTHHLRFHLDPVSWPPPSFQRYPCRACRSVCRST